MIRRLQGPVPPTSTTAGTLVTDAAKPATSYTNTGLTAGTQYSYALFAHDGTPVYAAAATVTSTTTAIRPGVTVLARPLRSSVTRGTLTGRPVADSRSLNGSDSNNDGRREVSSSPYEVSDHVGWVKLPALEPPVSGRSIRCCSAQSRCQQGR